MSIMMIVKSNGLIVKPAVVPLVYLPAL